MVDLVKNVTAGLPMKSIRTPLIWIILLTALGRAQTQFEGELVKLKHEHDKALAAATAPIDKKYLAALEDLLRRATKTNDLDAALKIRSALEAFNSERSAAIDPSQIKTKHALGKALLGTKWSFARTPEDARKTTFTFTLGEDSQVLWADKSKGNWRLVDPRSIEIGPGGDGSWAKVLFDPTLSNWQSPSWFGEGPTYGVRRSQ